MDDQLTWFKSSYGDDEGGDRVEAAVNGTVRIRDSKNPTGPEPRVTASAWAAFVSAGRPGA